MLVPEGAWACESDGSSEGIRRVRSSSGASQFRLQAELYSVITFASEIPADELMALHEEEMLCSIPGLR